MQKIYQIGICHHFKVIDFHVCPEASRDFNTSDMEKEWESKNQYHLLTPTPSPGVTPGNSPSSISNSPVFTEFPKKVPSKKKNPSVVRWVCETETETDSEFEHRLLPNTVSPINDARNNITGIYQTEGPSVVIHTFKLTAMS